jgi:hypothetical protein
MRCDAVLESLPLTAFRAGSLTMGPVATGLRFCGCRASRLAPCRAQTQSPSPRPLSAHAARRVSPQNASAQALLQPRLMREAGWLDTVSVNILG